MHATYTLATQTRQDPAPVVVGSREMPVRTSAFGTEPAKSLTQFAASAGEYIETWQWWFHAAADGQYLIVGKIAGDRGQASLRVDGSATPAPKLEVSGDGPSVGDAVIDLGRGWHQAELVVQHDAQYAPHVQTTIYLRGPHASTPTTVTPWSIVASGETGAAPAKLVPLAPASATTATTTQSAAGHRGGAKAHAAAVVHLPAGASSARTLQGQQQ